MDKETGIRVNRTWEEIRKNGGECYPIETIKNILEGDNKSMAAYSRQEIIDRIADYFQSITEKVVDEDSGEVRTVWKRNPTKSGLALSLNMTVESLSRIVNDRNTDGQPFQEKPTPTTKIGKPDFDVILTAYTLITDFYEQNLGKNMNNSGSIFWLNNAQNGKWSNQQEFTFNQGQQGNVSQHKSLEQIAQEHKLSYELSVDDIPPEADF